MALYFKDIEITKLRDLAPQTGLDITDTWFGETNVYTVWETYEGTLPATINANGADMRQYQVWGNTGGVGDKTANLFDISAQTLIDVTGTGVIRTGVYLGFLAVGQYTLTFDAPHNYSLFITRKNGSTYTYQDVKKSQLPFTFSVNNGDEIIIRLTNTQSFEQQQFTNVSVTSGTTPPATYVPFGYEVPIGVKSSNIMPSAPAETKTLNGVTITCDGEGRYSISGRNTKDFEISFDIQEFTIPTSIEQGGTGTLSFFNDFISNNLYIVFRFNSTFIGSFSFDRLNRVNTSYQQISKRKINKIILKNNNGTTISPNGNFNLMFTDNNVLPAKYQPYFNTTTPIYIGDDPLDKDEYVDYAEQKVYRRTANLFDKNATDTTNGYVSGGYLTVSGEIINNGNWSISEYIEIDQNKIYVLNNLRANAAYCLYDNVKNLISGARYDNESTITFDSENAKYIRLSVVTKSTLPSYNLDILTLTSGTTTDPPVPLPALPTCEGTTIVDYAGSGAVPEKAFLKYRKENF